MTEAWLIDKSGLVLMPFHPDEPLWSQRVDDGLVHICGITVLELGSVARKAADHARVLGGVLLGRMIVEWNLPMAVTRRAYEVQGLLAASGQGRMPGIPDLLVAAVAESLHLTVLYHGHDFELIAEVTGQPLYRLS